MRDMQAQPRHYLGPRYKLLYVQAFPCESWVPEISAAARDSMFGISGQTRRI